MVPSVRAVFIGDYVSTEVILNEYYDSLTLDFYCKKLFPVLPRTSTALDIGANIGNHTVVLAKYFDHVIAFEPNPQTAHVLRANTMRLSVDVIEKGISDVHGSRELKLSFDNVGGSRIVDMGSHTTIEVETIDRLSEQLEIGNVSFLKIDVEGHEARVLAGAKEFLRSQRPVIALELHSSLVRGVAERVDKELRDAGYNYMYALMSVKKEENRWMPRMFEKAKREFTLKTIDRITESYDQLIVSSKPILLN